MGCGPLNVLLCSIATMKLADFFIRVLRRFKLFFVIICKVQFCGAEAFGYLKQPLSDYNEVLVVFIRFLLVVLIVLQYYDECSQSTGQAKGLGWLCRWEIFCRLGGPQTHECMQLYLYQTQNI